MVWKHAYRALQNASALADAAQIGASLAGDLVYRRLASARSTGAANDVAHNSKVV